MPDKEERIRMRAYEIWEREGRLDGRHEHNWEEARREIEGEDAAGGRDPEAPTVETGDKSDAARTGEQGSEAKSTSGKRRNGGAVPSAVERTTGSGGAKAKPATFQERRPED